MVPQSGKPYPLGATSNGSGVNFSLFSSVAQSVELCLFDDAGRETRYELPDMTALCWHGYFPGLQPGQKYAFRVHGPWAPAAGLRCNSSKLLLDPYAKCIYGQVQWNEAVFPHYFTGSQSRRNDLDSARYVPRCVVIDPHFDWGSDQPLRTPWERTVIYELHVKGFTKKHPEVPADLRGKFLGLTHPSVIEYFKTLGVTAIELMPAQAFVHDMYLEELGLKNYWGYNTIGFFTPQNEYATPSGDIGREITGIQTNGEVVTRSRS